MADDGRFCCFDDFFTSWRCLSSSGFEAAGGETRPKGDELVEFQDIGDSSRRFGADGAIRAKASFRS
jgi:hypothetical protein